MQDIDFDEIDRAVNSITSSNTPVAQTAVVETPELVVSAAPVVASPAVRRSGGRFMDVVHPSSDMRPSAPAPRPAAPSAPSLHREEVAERHDDATVSRPEPAAIASSAFHWPDPIETPFLAPVPEPISAPVIASDETADSLESPFLSDAKVEKRPLGAFSGADADLPLLEDPVPFSGQQLPVATVPAVVQASEVDLDVDLEPETPAPTEELHELHEDVLSLDKHEQEVVQSEPTPVMTGPISITQQYAEQPSIVNEPTGSIYDTEAYHQPLAQTHKKRSGLLVAIWIVALIIVGAGIGAGIYFVVLPLLG